MVSVKNVIVDVIVMKICVLIVQMMFVVIVIVIREKMGIFRHENMLMDMSVSSKTKLYKNDKLLFIGDGYKAISIMLNNSKNQQPVREKFHNQLTMREKPKFSKTDELEKLRKEAYESISTDGNYKKSRKRN
tara:strand:+ start:111 stop:506 length:396 start_codon:yes stop_codon:yes gene_type:complete